MGLYIQNSQVSNSNNNYVSIDIDKKVVEKRFHTPSQYLQEISVVKKLQSHSLTPELIAYSEKKQLIKYKYVRTTKITVSDRLKALKMFHDLKILDFPLSKSIQVESIEQLLKGVGYNVLKECLIHGDPSPDNFIKGKDGQLYLIDFEESCLSDPVIDIALFIIENTNIAKTEESYTELDKAISKIYDSDTLMRFYHIKKSYFKSCMSVLEKWWQENNDNENIQYKMFKERIINTL